MEWTLSQIAEKIGGRVQGDGAKRINAAAPFEIAGEKQITFADSPKFFRKLRETGAGAIIVPDNIEEKTRDLIQVKNPKVSFIRTVGLLHPQPLPAQGIHPTAVLGEDVDCGENVSIGPHVCVGRGAVVGDRSVLHPGVVLGEGVHLGSDVLIHPNVSVLDRCRIGDRVIIHSGTVIGSDGYGFAQEGDIHIKIPHLGIVQIDDDVEIGAGCTIDRATFGKTWIRKGVKTDNLVHIAHNVTIGENTLVIAQVGIAGSVTVGSNVILAAQAGIAGHLTIADRVIVGPRAAIVKDLESGQIVSGTPAIDHRTHLKAQRVFPELPELKKKVRELEKRLLRLEEDHTK